MKTKRKILSLAISAMLTAGVASYPMSSYADDDDHSSSGSEHSSSSEHSSGSDSDRRSANDSGNRSHQKITICHVPPGNPANKHTIHIAYSAWAAHKLHTNTNTTGQPRADYLGSCNNLPTTSANPPTTTRETLHVISGCTGTARDTLLTKVQSYFDPIIVQDTALDDESVATSMSQCLDKGDSSDSSHSNSASSGKGGGHDSVSDSGHHHRIRGCQNKDTEHRSDSNNHHGVSDSDRNDANKNYHKKLKDADSGHDTANHIKDPIVVSDSSLDDSGVWRAYKTCAADSNDANKIDSGKAGKKKGDSGHKQHILKSCGDTQDQAVKDAVDAYRAKDSTKAKDIILTETSYTDVSLKAAVDACVAAGAKDTTKTPSSSGTSGRLNFRENTAPK